MRPTPSQVRITSQHLQSGQYNNQQVRAVGKLVSVDGSGSVQLQLAGDGERLRACPRYCCPTLTVISRLLRPRPTGHDPLRRRFVRAVH